MLSQLARESRTSRNEISTFLGLSRRSPSSITGIYLRQLSRFRGGRRNQEQWQDDTARVSDSRRSRSTRSTGSLCSSLRSCFFWFSRVLQRLRLGTMSEGYDAPPPCSHANT